MRGFRRGRKRSSSRNCAMKSKKPLLPDNKTKVDTMEETSDGAPEGPSSELRFRAVFSAVGWVVQKCRKTINQICCGIQNALLFWRGYAERVEALHQKVEDLQKEITLLRSTLKLSGEAKSAGVPCETPDGVQSAPPRPLALPPPPPPPPPPPLPQIFLTLAAPKVPLIPKKAAQTGSLKEKQNVPVAVTLRDLQAVRLRKVTVGQKTQMSPDRRRSPLVTLADLQKVRLRRSHSDLPLKFRSSLGRTPTKNPMNLRVPLRKVNLIRSPGGTPLCNKENDGMDPSMPSGNKRLRALTSGLSPLQSL